MLLRGKRGDVLLETVEAWLDHGGSIDQIAHHMFCHPNTVRPRLRREEMHTGRSVNNPRDATELSSRLKCSVDYQRPREIGAFGRHPDGVKTRERNRR